jgi:hypothetical protein
VELVVQIGQGDLAPFVGQSLRENRVSFVKPLNSTLTCITILATTTMRRCSWDLRVFHAAFRVESKQPVVSWLRVTSFHVKNDN